MRPVSRLDRLERTARCRALALRQLTLDNMPVSPVSWSASDQRLTSYIIIEATNLWAQYARTYYLCTALQARANATSKVTLTIAAPPRTIDEALGIAISHLNPRVIRPRKQRYWKPRDEPDWQQPPVLRRLLGHLGASNYSGVDSAASLAPETMKSLPRMRIYFAHKGQRTAISARRIAREYGVVGDPHPMELLYDIAPQMTQPLVVQWLDDLTRVIRATAP